MPRTRKFKPYVPLEREVQKSGIALLRGLGWECHRRNVSATRWVDKKGNNRLFKTNAAGMADTWGTMPDGRRFEIEFKRPGKRPTAKQLAWLKSQNGPHCCAFWVDSTCVLEKVARHLMNVGTIFYDSESGVDEDYYWLT
jgi:hypothetical protein